MHEDWKAIKGYENCKEQWYPFFIKSHICALVFWEPILQVWVLRIPCKCTTQSHISISDIQKAVRIKRYFYLFVVIQLIKIDLTWTYMAVKHKLNWHEAVFVLICAFHWRYAAVFDYKILPWFSRGFYITYRISTPLPFFNPKNSELWNLSYQDLGKEIVELYKLSRSRIQI